MVFDIKTQAMVNLTIQVLLIMTVFGAVFLAFASWLLALIIGLHMYLLIWK